MKFSKLLEKMILKILKTIDPNKKYEPRLLGVGEGWF